MFLGPLFRVEMVSVARRRRYFLLRVVYGALALFILWTTYTSLRAFSLGASPTISIQQGATLATGFFVAFSWLQIITVLTVGPALAVGTIATERERRTIEYLFTTDLSNAEIILGKLVARLCLFGQILLVGLPILFLFRLLGGIPARLLVVTFLFAASTSLLIASLSICVSVWSERARDATVRVYLLLGVLTFLPIILQTSAGWGPFRGALWEATGKPVVDFCMTINPLWSLGNAIGNTSAIGARLNMALIWQTVSQQVMVSLVAIGLAIFAVRRVHLKETTKAAGRARSRWNLRFPRWQRPLGDNPMIWKEVFAGTSMTKLGLIGWVAIALILLTVCGIMLTLLINTLQAGTGSRRNGFHIGIMGLTGYLGPGILLLLAARAAGLVTSEKERDCWLSLLATPLTGREIIRSKMWGNLYSLRWPLVVLMINWGLGVLLAPNFLLAALALLGTYLLMAWYVTNLGLFFSLRSLTTLRAMGATLGTLIFTGGGYMFCCCMVMASSGGSQNALMIFLAPCIPFLSVFPLLAYFEFVEGNHFGMIEEGMIAAYGLGIVGYLIVGFALYLYMGSNFDRLAGRTVEKECKMQIE
ncbi:MAG: ABC transporter permease subunit [Planctomycetes bacterium]|nr:ABC transporter permease subunit [Planctomycetota bacterium]